MKLEPGAPDQDSWLRLGGPFHGLFVLSGTSRPETWAVKVAQDSLHQQNDSCNLVS